MAGLQDLAVRLAEILDIPEAEALKLTNLAQPVILIESIIGIPTTRVPGLIGGPASGGHRISAEAALKGHVQLFNPAGSGVNVHVDRVIAGLLTAGLMRVTRFDTGLTTDSDVSEWADFRRTGSPVGQLRRQTNAANLGTPIGRLNVLGTTSFVIDFDHLILGEGNGVVLLADTVNVEISAYWFWREVQN
ncbi:MAG: hypothetical protein V3T26_08620 [candidate division NC10 bacterium]